jgi:mannitol/fructose-specific phosphotransferase system IIA component (Ntr-type)
MMYEAAFSLKQSANGILNMEDLHAIQSPTGLEPAPEILSLLTIEQIIPRLKSESKEGVIWELVSALFPGDNMQQIKSIYYTVMERENHLSGGLAHGFAIPHAHTDEVSKPLIAMGIKPEGIDFGSIDNKPSHVFFLILTPVNDANVHIRLLSNISRLSRQPQVMSELLKMADAEQIRRTILSKI